jgi:hypothetical protein
MHTAGNISSRIHQTIEKGKYVRLFKGTVPRDVCRNFLPQPGFPFVPNYYFPRFGIC